MKLILAAFLVVAIGQTASAEDSTKPDNKPVLYDAVPGDNRYETRPLRHPSDNIYDAQPQRRPSENIYDARPPKPPVYPRDSLDGYREDVEALVRRRCPGKNGPLLILTIERSGKLKAKEILMSSGDAAVDTRVLKNLGTQSYPPIPQSVPGPELILKIDLSKPAAFKVESRAVQWTAKPEHEPNAEWTYKKRPEEKDKLPALDADDNMPEPLAEPKVHDEFNIQKISPSTEPAPTIFPAAR